MKMGVIVLLFWCLEGCHRAVRDAVPSTKTVDSAAAVAPDTIKALPLDSVDRAGAARDPMNRDSTR